MTSHDQKSQFESTFANHPPVDFANEEAREAMREALRSVLTQLGKNYGLVIGGQQVQSSETISRVDPSFNERLVGEVSSGQAVHVDDAVVEAKRALPEWRAMGAVGRAGLIRQAAQVMRDRFFELAAWEVYECGKGWREATDRGRFA